MTTKKTQKIPKKTSSKSTCETIEKCFTCKHKFSSGYEKKITCHSCEKLFCYKHAYEECALCEKCFSKEKCMCCEGKIDFAGTNNYCTNCSSDAGELLCTKCVQKCDGCEFKGCNYCGEVRDCLDCGGIYCERCRNYECKFCVCDETFHCELNKGRCEKHLKGCATIGCKEGYHLELHYEGTKKCKSCGDYFCEDCFEEFGSNGKCGECFKSSKKISKKKYDSSEESVPSLRDTRREEMKYGLEYIKEMDSFIGSLVEKDKNRKKLKEEHILLCKTYKKCLSLEDMEENKSEWDFLWYAPYAMYQSKKDQGPDVVLYTRQEGKYIYNLRMFIKQPFYINAKDNTNRLLSCCDYNAVLEVDYKK